MKNLSNLNNQVWVEAGVGNTRRIVNLSEMYQKLGQAICDALPGIYAITGCDFNPAIYRKGRKAPFETVISSPKFLKAMSEISCVVDRKPSFDTFKTEEFYKTFEEFSCSLYGFKVIDCVHEARYRIFDNTYNVQNKKEILNLDVKNVDPANIPPCKAELYMHILRTGFIAHMWKNAHKSVVSDADPTNYGWKEIYEADGSKYLDFDWFVGDQLPPMAEILVDESASNDNEDGKKNFTTKF